LTLKRLAEHLGLSIGTVSRALNGKRYVDPKTRERVIAAAAELGYVPNQTGRSLRQGTSGMIAMILPTNPGMPIADTIFMPVIDGLRGFLGERKLDIMILVCGPDESPYDHLRRVATRRLADGFVIADTQRHDPRIDYLLERGTPFVAFGRSLSGGSQPWVDLDFEGVARTSVQRLVEKGHRRIALGTMVTELNFGYVFADAFSAALGEQGLAADTDLICRVENTEEGGYQLGELLLGMADRPTAVLLGNETMAVGLYRRLAEAGLTPGRDLSIIAFGESQAARFLTPKVTFFRTDLRGLGIRLGQGLLATIPSYAGATSGPPVQEVWPMEIVPGESDGDVLTETERRKHHAAA
jgi:DNA-binding LacI/PurR family transcriptional regulator